LDAAGEKLLIAAEWYLIDTSEDGWGRALADQHIRQRDQGHDKLSFAL